MPTQTNNDPIYPTPVNLPGYQALYSTIRSRSVESLHYGAVAVVKSDGTLFASAGDPQARTFMRSSAKPFQCIPLLEMGGMERFNLSQEELAVMCASHSGSNQHLRIITTLQRKIGITESDLLCGTHPPGDKASRQELQDQGHSPKPNHHNCSGKHTGMLAQANMIGVPGEKYTEIDHPVQQGILSVLSEMAGIDSENLSLGRDGCSVPSFSVPLYNAAWAWAKLVDPTDLSPIRIESCKQITTAMTNKPFYVAGKGRLDTRLMETAQGKIISKAGAEAFQAIGVFPDAIQPGSPALGIALKISDGDHGKRARRAVILEVLQQLEILTEEEQKRLCDLGPIQPIHNRAGILVGEARPCFQLQYQ